jgi:hypothetical protein
MMATLSAAPSLLIERTVDEWRAEAEAYAQAGRLDEAEDLLVQIIQAMPNHHPTLHQAAIIAYKRKRPLEALARFERALHLMPEMALYHRHICEPYRSLSRLDEALAHAQRAVELAPGDADAAYNLGVVHYDRLEIEQAIRFVRQALELNPAMTVAHLGLGELLLLTGRFEDGWREYAWGFDLPSVRRLLPADRPLWDGKPMLDGTLVLIGEQGFGDTIQFCRYIQEVVKLCPNLIVACCSEMRPIVMQQRGITQYSGREEDIPAGDAYCPLSALPRLFGTNLTNIPASAPYVTADPLRADQWRRRLDALVPKTYRRIGLVWAGRSTHPNDFHRSMSLTQIGALAQLQGVALVSLQMGSAQAEIGRYYGSAPLINLGAEIRDFSDTMAILDGLDRLVSVDTGVAHLAGAMAKPVSILLPYAPDWRWLMARTDSPWYPTVSLCRQARPGHWGSAIDALVGQLHTESASIKRVWRSHSRPAHHIATSSR